ncbi:gliding motility-associated C-terminal domain-containing protein [Chitinophaga oryzae]|uniref:Gliding motility-associated C-terminal domain-containing protein n=1 Tax=Chitinophaga oryzae TaxID=2725414 RepID=A0AAE6ZF74_9BACT|nr:MBG domain-containing protein [Chitinophaga oryzae]QJB31865.1 gliding motility-associated C-terminal domain-containing protein [Chitinophaga oryzae]
MAAIVQAQNPGDLAFTGFTTFDDDTDGSIQDDAFSFVLFRDLPANTNIYFTDLGWTGSDFQSLSCPAGGSQTDGIIRWQSGPATLKAGQVVVITCKYKLTASVGTVTGIQGTVASGNKEYISLGLAGDQLFAYTGVAPFIQVIAGLNINRSAWDASLDPCEFTSSKSMLPGSVPQSPGITAVNGRYNCNVAAANSVPALQALIQDPANWAKDNTMAAPVPAAYDLKKTPPCQLAIVNPGAGGILYVNNQSASSGDGSSWSAPLKELRDALSAAANPAYGITQIWVAKGTYKPSTTDPAASFALVHNIPVYGGFAGTESNVADRIISAHPVVLSGDIDNNDVLTNGIVLKPANIQGINSYHVVTANGGNITLDGVTITGGKTSNSTGGPNGAGFYTSNSSTITIRNARFYGNKAGTSGGALYLPATSNATITNSSFFGNEAGTDEGTIASNGTLKLINTTIAGNISSGIKQSGGQLDIYNSIVTNNTVPLDVIRTGGFINYYYTVLGLTYYANNSSSSFFLNLYFTDINNGDLTLTATSPVINKGDPSTNANGYPAQAGNTDLAGQPRISNTSIDPGAFEYQAQPQTITFNPITARTYGDNNFYPSATSNGDGAITYTSGNPAVATIVNGAIKITGAGTTQITATAGASNGYLANTTGASQTLTVNKKTLTVTPVDNTRPYYTADPTFTGTYSGFVYNENASVVHGAATYSTATTLTSPVGVYAITADVSGLSADNYSFTGATGNLTITPTTQNINFSVPAEVTYGVTPITLTKQTDSGLDIVYAVSGPATVTGNMLSITGAGTVTINASQPGDVNHFPAAPVSKNLTVKKATLTATADDKTRSYKQANPALDYTITGFVNGDNSSVVSGVADISTAADMSSVPGTYPITMDAGTLYADNYDFNVANGTLTVTKAMQTISFPVIPGKTYGAAPFSLNATSDAGLPVNYTATGPGTISGDMLTVTGTGTITVTATQGGDNNYDAAAAVQTSITVSKAPLSLVADNLSREYGRNNPALTYYYNGFVNGEDASVLTGSVALATTADLNSTPGSYPIQFTSVTTSNNYNIVPVDGMMTITAAPQTISFPAISDKTYGDGGFTPGATSSSGLPVTYAVVSGPATVSGSTINITGAGTVTIAAKQAGDGNYDPAQQETQTFRISKAVLTVTANNKTRAYKQANPLLDYTITGFVNGDGGSVVNGTAAIATTAGPSSDAGIYPINITLGTLHADNYDFSFTDGSLTITTLPQTISFPALADQTYGVAPIALNATSDAGLPVNYNVTGPVTVTGNILTVTGAGTVVVTASQPGNNNYDAANPSSQSFTVKKAYLTFKADNKTREYRQNDPQFTYSFTGFVNGDDASVVNGANTIRLSTPADILSIPGDYPIMISAALSTANYIIIPANGTLTVTTAQQSINFPAISSKTYGDAPFALSATSSSGLPVRYSVISGPATVSGNTVTITGSGSVTIGADQVGDSNYKPAAQEQQTFQAGKALLTVTANDKTRAYKQPNPLLDYTITGYIGADNGNVVAGTVTASTTAGINSPAGTYPISLSDPAFSAANYDFTYKAGTLTVTPASQVITFDAIADKVYGDPSFALQATSDAGLPVTFAVTGGPAAISGNILSINGTGTVTVTATQSGDVNYNAAAAVSRSFKVTPATLTVKANDLQRPYGNNNPPLTYTVTGFVYQEDNRVLTGAPTLSTTADASSAVGTYPIGITAGNLSAANYTFRLTDGVLTVGQTSQTISFPAIGNKTYGDAAFTLSATSTSQLPVTYTVLSGPATISGNTVTITGAGAVSVAADQAGDARYTPATRVINTFNINKAVLTVTAADKNRAYGEPNPALTYTISGFVYNDNNSVVNGDANISTAAQATSAPGTYPVTVSAGSLAAAHYSFRFENGQLTVAKAAQNIRFNTLANKTYGDVPFAISATSNAGLPVSLAVTAGPATISGNMLHITGVGTVTVTATQNGDANYNAAAPVSQSFTVLPAVLQVKANDQQRDFGSANPALTYTISGFVYNENHSVVSGTPALSTTANITSVAGMYPISIAAGSLHAANYHFTLTGGTLTVGPADQSITFPAISDRTYGDAAFTLSATASSTLPVGYRIVSGPATINGNTVTLTGAGTVTIAASQPGNSGFKPAAPVNRTFNVAKAALTVTAKNDTRTYNGATYTGGNGVAYTGFVNGDNTGRLTGTLSYSGTSQGAVNAGTYNITPGGLNSNDYTLTYNSGTLTIQKASQQISFTAPGNKNQGDADFPLVATASSGLPVSFSSNNTTVVAVSGSTATAGNAGTAVITASQAGNGNYEAAAPVMQTIVVTAYRPPVITAQGATVFCEGGSVTLQSTAAPAYEWYRNNIRINGAGSRTLTITESGSYTVKAIYPNNAGVTSAATQVTVNPLPAGHLQVNGNTTISKGESVTLVASGGASYHWEPATGLSDATAPATVARPTATTTYRVTISNAAGCSVVKDVTINVKEDYKLEPTNILTPNGDGINDVWVVKNIDMYPQNEVKIFDRTGRMIYRQRGYTNNWKGTVNGQRLAEGTYYYIIDLGENRPLFKGFITIVHEN